MKPATFRLVAQYFKQTRYRIPPPALFSIILTVYNCVLCSMLGQISLSFPQFLHIVFRHRTIHCYFLYFLSYFYLVRFDGQFKLLFMKFSHSETINQ